jgi:hypothetical protein
VLDQMTTKPKLVVLDTMNFWMDCFTRIIRSDKRVDVITINDEEARQLIRIFSCKAAAKKPMGTVRCNQKKRAWSFIIS